jgi:hypothetical protein
MHTWHDLHVAFTGLTTEEDGVLQRERSLDRLFVHVDFSTPRECRWAFGGGAKHGRENFHVRVELQASYAGRLLPALRLLQLLPHSQNAARDARNGSGIADHVWSLDELIGG